MDGILNVLKPPGMTSFDVVGYLRGVLRIKKIGHTGTLDPAAAGVLPVCIGKAAKTIEFMMEKDKRYRAELTLGSDTDTQDSTGKTVQVRKVTSSAEKIAEVIHGFKGKYMQVPPMYSAIKVNGKKLYELARSGITIEREAREVEIYSIDIIHMEQNLKPPAESVKVIFDVHCSKGTYIRTLCADIGDRLGCGGHMSFLLRMKAGVFDISQALTLEEVARLGGNGGLTAYLVNADEVFKDYEEIVIGGSDEKRLLNGISLRCNIKNTKPGDLVRIYNEKRSFLALGEIVERQEEMMLKSKKLFV